MTTLLCSLGCAATPHQAASPPATLAAAPLAPRSISFNATPQKLWAALPRAYKSVGITVNAIDTTTRSVGFAGVIRHELGGTRLSKFFDCGNQIGENADNYDVNLYVATQMGRSQETGRLLVTTGLRVSARSPAFAGTMTICSSKGELERRIVAAINEEVKR